MRATLPLCAALLLLAGCAEPLQRASEYDYRTNHPLMVQPRSASLILDGFDRAKLDSFAADYVARGHGALEISMGAANAQDAEAREEHQ